MLKYPGRSSSEKLLSYRDQEAVSGTWPERGLNREADYKIRRETESTAYQGPAKVDAGGMTLMLPISQTHYRPKGKGTWKSSLYRGAPWHCGWRKGYADLEENGHHQPTWYHNSSNISGKGISYSEKSLDSSFSNFPHVTSLVNLAILNTTPLPLVPFAITLVSRFVLYLLIGSLQ